MTGAPVIDGLAWGKTVNMLKKTLVDGFNSQTVTSITIVSDFVVELNYSGAHGYEKYQTIRVLGNSNPLYNVEGVVTSITTSKVTLKVYASTTGLTNQTGLSGVTSIVAPLDMTLKFSTGNRAVFVTEQGNFHLYIDDEQPSNWSDRNPILPLVFMTNNMSDIDTVTGDTIVPYDASYPTRYKTRGYTDQSSANKNGIWQFTVRSNAQVSTPYNTVADTQAVSRWYIIGNSNFFYFFIFLNNSSTINTLWQNYYFGKFKSNVIGDAYNCLLGANSVGINSNCFATSSNNGGANGFTNLPNRSSTTEIYPSLQGIGTEKYALLRNCYGTLTAKPSFAPQASGGLNMNNNIILSGLSGLTYPDPVTGKYIISKINIEDTNVIRGTMPGAYHIHHANYYPEFSSIAETTDGTSTKFLLHISQSFLSSTAGYQSGRLTAYYAIDINSAWNNYD